MYALLESFLGAKYKPRPLTFFTAYSNRIEQRGFNFLIISKWDFTE